MAAWGYVRATGDLDILVVPSPMNAERVYRALKAFGAPLKSVDVSDFNSPGTVYQIGLPPLRIDVLTEVDGLDSREAYLKAKRIRVAGVQVRVLSLDHLIQNKSATSREKDQLDVKVLRKMKGARNEKSKK